MNLAKKIAAAKEYVKTFGDETTRAAHAQMVEVGGAGTLQRAQNGEFSTASMDELDKTIKKLKEYQALIKDPNGTGKEAFGTTKEQVDALTEQLNNLKGVAEKVKGSFKDADEVLARFGEHMNAGKTASEGMAQTLDEKLSAKTSSYDDAIKNAADAIEFWENQLEEAKKNTAEFEKELDKLEKKYESRSALGKKTPWGKREKQDIEELRSILDGDGAETNFGWRPEIERSKSMIDSWKESLEYWKQQKAEELGMTEQVEEKKQEAQRLTQEQMQEGIKLLEEEYRKTDHTTAEGHQKIFSVQSLLDQVDVQLPDLIQVLVLLSGRDHKLCQLLAERAEEIRDFLEIKLLHVRVCHQHHAAVFNGKLLHRIREGGEGAFCIDVVGKLPIGIDGDHAAHFIRIHRFSLPKVLLWNSEWANSSDRPHPMQHSAALL